MNTSDFFYDLPQELIAQHPIEPRDHSRLLVVDRENGDLKHGHFYDILDELKEGDCLIVNNTRVLPARMFGTKKETGARVEFLLLNTKGDDLWECITGPGKRAKPGTSFTFGDGLLEADVIDVLEGGNRLVKFRYEGNFYNVIDQIGQMPLPPYITETLDDQERYQTVYSKELGSAAAPTAGLHFTDELIEKIKAKGVKVGYVTLHVGLGTFRPVKVDDISKHTMHSEHYWLPKETAVLINDTKKNGGRVIAVGTTSCRTLESVATFNGKIEEAEGNTDIFIYPGYKFHVVDHLTTNFHLPQSSLIMLVAALCGRERILDAYAEAVKEEYRFFSYGDAMFVR